MKRSEMMLILEGVFEAYDNFEGCTPEFVSDKILETVEALGMLPPLNAFDDYLWEPEDD